MRANEGSLLCLSLKVLRNGVSRWGLRAEVSFVSHWVWLWTGSSCRKQGLIRVLFQAALCVSFQWLACLPGSQCFSGYTRGRSGLMAHSAASQLSLHSLLHDL